MGIAALLIDYLMSAFLSPWVYLALTIVLPIWWSRRQSTAANLKGVAPGYKRMPYSSRNHLKRGEFVMRPELFHFSETFKAGEPDVYHADCRHDLWLSTKHYYIMPGQPSDGASIPWFCRSVVGFLDPGGCHEPAARFHDAAFRLGFVDFHEANLDFSLMMKAFGTPALARIVIFMAVWAFGRKAWDEGRKNEEALLAELKAYKENPADLGFYDVMREQIAEYDKLQAESGHPGEPN